MGTSGSEIKSRKLSFGQRLGYGTLFGFVLLLGLVIRWLESSNFSASFQWVAIGVLVICMSAGSVALVIWGACLAMPKMKPVIFTAVAAISLLLLLGTAALWMESHRWYGVMRWQGYDVARSESNDLWLYSHRGVMAATLNVRSGPPPGMVGWENLTMSADGFRLPGSGLIHGSSWLNRMGFGLQWTPSVRGGFAISVTIPWWLPAALCMVLPGWSGIWIGRRVWRRRKIARGGVCPKCGYDLRASKVRCPECGTAVAAEGPGSSRALL